MRDTLFALITTSILASACAPIRGNPDPFSGEERTSTGLPVLGMRWQATITDNLRERKPQEFASAVVQHDRVFIGSHAGMLHALSTRRGSVKWRAKIGSMSSRPVVAGARLFAGTDDGFLVALSTDDGSEKWRYSTRGPILQSPVVSGDSIFVANEADQVYALDRDTGKFRWQYKGETPEEFTIRGHAGIAVDGDMVYTGFSNGTMVALRAATGTVAWMTSLKGEATRFMDVDGTPVIFKGSIYVTSSASGVYALDKQTGLVRWRLPIRNAGGLTVDDQRIYVAAADTGIYALDHSGNVVWRQGTRGGGEPAAPQVSGDYLIYTLSDDGLFIANKRTGVLHQYFDPGTGVSSQPTVEDDRLYVLSNGGVLYAMNLRRF